MSRRYFSVRFTPRVCICLRIPRSRYIIIIIIFRGGCFRSLIRITIATNTPPQYPGTRQKNNFVRVRKRNITALSRYILFLPWIGFAKCSLYLTAHAEGILVKYDMLRRVPRDLAIWTVSSYRTHGICPETLSRISVRIRATDVVFLSDVTASTSTYRCLISSLSQNHSCRVEIIIFLPRSTDTVAQ